MPKILLVDDDTELSELLANFLTLEGFRVTIAKTDQIAQQLDLSYLIRCYCSHMERHRNPQTNPETLFHTDYHLKRPK